MQKYRLVEGHLVIFTRTQDGTEISFKPNEFNDQLGDLLCQNNQEHLVIFNPNWQDNIVGEKKTFVQITENVILLTSNQEQIEKKPLSETVNEPKLKRKRGGQPANKA